MTSPLQADETDSVGRRSPGPDTGPPLVLSLLSHTWGRVGRSRTGRRFLDASGIRPFARAWLRRSVLQELRSRPDDVTVLLGVRDRSDYRIENALRSIRNQVEPPGALKIMVVDYGSEPEGARFVETLCARYGAEYVRVDAPGIWSRGRCLNVGLRLVETTFAMVSDADIVLSPRYVADAVATLREAPLSVVCAPMLDLPEASVDAWRAVARDEAPLDVQSWREQCTPRLNRDLHSSIAITYTAYFRLICGYDEYYEGWGREDADLMRRFRALGLQRRALPSSSFYLHQWHPKFEGLTDEEQARSIERNAAHYRAQRSIVRNGRDWGLGRAG